MNTPKKFVLALTLFGALGIGAFANTVYAVSSENRAAVAEISDGDGETPDVLEAAAPSKVKLAQNRTSNRYQETEERADEHEERQEAARLQPLAKISAQQAQQAAETAVGDRAAQTRLENEDGNLVYSVEIGQKEVIVDAGNGRVLQIEAANEKESEAAETSYPRSSIQVREDRERGADFSR